MNIAFRDLDEYKKTKEVLKRRSLNVKNKNIKCACKIRNLTKKYPVLAEAKKIVERLCTKNQDHRYLIKEIKKVVDVKTVAFDDLYDFIGAVVYRCTERAHINKQNKDVLGIIKQGLKERARSKTKRELYKHEVSLHEFFDSLGIYSVSNATKDKIMSICNEVLKGVKGFENLPFEMLRDLTQDILSSPDI